MKDMAKETPSAHEVGLASWVLTKPVFQCISENHQRFAVLLTSSKNLFFDYFTKLL